MRLKLLSAETTLGTATTVSNATVVRLYNKNAGDQVITNSNGSTMTMPTGSIAYIVKDPTETLSASADVLAVSIAYT
jgi:hypothetical protein